MRHHTPDNWVIIKVKNQLDILYRVFGCWSGNNMSLDSWKINSGIESARKEGRFWFFESFCGSIYKCHEESYGLQNYGSTVLSNFIASAREEGVKITQMKQNTEWGKLNYEQY